MSYAQYDAHGKEIIIDVSRYRIHLETVALFSRRGLCKWYFISGFRQTEGHSPSLKYVWECVFSMAHMTGSSVVLLFI